MTINSNDIFNNIIRPNIKPNYRLPPQKKKVKFNNKFINLDYSWKIPLATSMMSIEVN